MTRPLALIEGDLALPNARLLHGLPPPFGSQRRAARVASPRRTQPVPAAAQQAIQNVVRHKTPLRRSPLPPGTMFRFFYKVKQPRDYSAHINAQLAEARHYLEAGKKRECSSRSDYVLGAAIFAVTSIALAWLLTTGVMREAEKAVTVARWSFCRNSRTHQHSPPLRLHRRLFRVRLQQTSRACGTRVDVSPWRCCKHRV
jgi:hypothetical protein